MSIFTYWLTLTSLSGAATAEDPTTVVVSVEFISVSMPLDLELAVAVRFVCTVPGFCFIAASSAATGPLEITWDPW